MSVRIIVDSTADTCSAVLEQCAIVPMTVTFGDEEFVDGVTISKAEFYDKLVQSKELPTTSQPTPDAFAKAYQEAVDAGQKAVVLTVSSKLSGTYQSATIAAMDFPGNVYVVDTCSVAIGVGVLAELAVNMAQSGATAEEIAKTITEEREKVRLIAVLDTLEYLKKGGRISKTVAFAGELLSVKPLVCVKEGEIGMLGKVRGLKQANVQLQKEIEALGVDTAKPVVYGYTGNDDSLLEKYLSEYGTVGNNPCHALVGSTIGTHVGPGAYAIAFVQK